MPQQGHELAVGLVPEHEDRAEQADLSTPDEVRRGHGPQRQRHLHGAGPRTRAAARPPPAENRSPPSSSPLTCTPPAAPQVRDIKRALSKANTPESAERKLGVSTLWCTCGRASEPGHIHYDGLKWDPKFKGVVAECAQSKSSKVKLILFVAGADYLDSWFVDIADHLVMQRGNELYDSEKICHLLPNMHGSGAGTKLSNAIKALQQPGKRGSLIKY